MLSRACIIITLLTICGGFNEAIAQMHLYGGKGHKTYLGCLDCNKYSSDSICNQYGTHGNRYNSDSIWNPYGSFGNKYASQSPWNKYSQDTDVPVLVDKAGNFYGYFTINKYRSNAVNFARDLQDVYEAFDGDLDELQEAFCDAF